MTTSLICSFSRGAEDSVDRESVANAIFYGDSVEWITTDFGAFIRGIQQEHNYWPPRDYSLPRKTLGSFLEMKYELSQLGPDIALVHRDICVPNSATFLESDAFCGIETDRRSGVNGAQVEIFKQQAKASAVLGNDANAWLPGESRDWGVAQQTFALQEALSRVMLPDIGALPFGELLKLKELVKDELLPLRAEMGRLTTCLKCQVEDGMEESEVAKDADRVIQSTIVPLALEAAAHIKAQREQRFRKWLAKSLEFLTYLGISCCADPTFTKGAISKGVSLAAEVSSNLHSKKLPTASARTILRIGKARE